ncbi:hypothetical protein CDAR_561651 [Caerostris darwini]|uniref:Uncharacterized protein n=1 Tax=Caerostris darwini TaxID=1538125 RepID=A0AAV4MIS7_9ARAC|nr:hypothetical protein CDAR_561651 [Caerostris darwini]
MKAFPQQPETQILTMDTHIPRFRRHRSLNRSEVDNQLFKRFHNQFRNKNVKKEHRKERKKRGAGRGVDKKEFNDPHPPRGKKEPGTETIRNGTGNMPKQWLVKKMVLIVQRHISHGCPVFLPPDVLSTPRIGTRKIVLC